jgi:hypothetical protein
MASERVISASLPHPRNDWLRSIGLLSILGRFRLHLPLLLLLALLLLVLAYQVLPTQTVAVGPLDERFIRDANAREMLPNLGREMRWTTAETHLRLPLVAANSPLLLDLTLINGYPQGLPPPTVDVEVDGRWLTDFVVEREVAGIRHYRLLVPPQQQEGWALPVTLYSSTVLLEEDPRPIGVMFVEAQLGALAVRPLLPPLWQVFAVLLVASAGYFMLRGIGAARWWAWAGMAMLLALLAMALALWHLQIAPYTMRLAGLLSLGALYGLAVALLSQPREQAQSSGVRLVSTARLVLLMGLAFWLMPAYQLVMTADGANDVTPYPPTFWLGALTLAACIFSVGTLFDMGRGGFWQRALLAALAAAAVAHLVIMIDFSLGRSGPDFWILFRGARDWFRGGSMYNLTAVQENHFGAVFKVPPFYGMLFLPFAQSDGLMILFWHRVLNIVLLALTLLLLFRAYRIALASVVGAGLLVLFNFRPVTDTIAYGQIDILLLLLIVVGLVAAQRNRPGIAGAAIALGTLFKLYPVLLLVFFVVKRQWRALIGFAVAMLILNGIAILAVGWEMHRVYLFEVLPRIGGGTNWVENQTLNGFVSRLVSGDIDAAPYHHPLVSVATYGGFLLALAGATWLAWQPAEPRSARYMLQYGIFAILMVLTVPAAWMHYQTITLLPFFALLLYSARGESGLNDALPRWRAALLAGAYALIAYGNPWSFFNGTIMGHLTFLGVSYKFYALVLLLAVTVACLRDQPPEAQPA